MRDLPPITRPCPDLTSEEFARWAAIPGLRHALEQAGSHSCSTIFSSEVGISGSSFTAFDEARFAELVVFLAALPGVPAWFSVAVLRGAGPRRNQCDEEPRRKLEFPEGVEGNPVKPQQGIDPAVADVPAHADPKLRQVAPRLPQSADAPQRNTLPKKAEP